MIKLEQITDLSSGVYAITGPCSMSSPCPGCTCPTHGTRQPDEQATACGGRVASMDSACSCILAAGHAGRCVCEHLAPVADEPTCPADPTVEIAYLRAKVADLKAERDAARWDLSVWAARRRAADAKVADAYEQGWDDALTPRRCSVTDLDTEDAGCGECGDCIPPNPYRRSAHPARPPDTQGVPVTALALDIPRTR